MQSIEQGTTYYIYSRANQTRPDQTKPNHTSNVSSVITQPHKRDLESQRLKIFINLQYLAPFLLFLIGMAVQIEALCWALMKTNVNDLRNRYEFLKEKQSPSTLSKAPTGDPSAGHCNATYVVNEDPARLPMKLPEAICNNCFVFECSPRFYWHKVLKKKCDYNTGEEVHVWDTVKLAVAFVYDPASR